MSDKCNAWECPHNKEGRCESQEQFEICMEELLAQILKSQQS